MTLVQDLSFEFEKEYYGLNDSDFFKFENESDSDISEDTISVITNEYDDDDMDETRDIIDVLNADSSFSFTKADPKFIDQVLNTQLFSGVQNMIKFQESGAAKTFKEIEEFGEVIKKFPEWAKTHYPSRHSYEIRYVDQSLNRFLFKHTPVNVYIEYRHKEERVKVLEKVREYLFEIYEETCYIQSELVTKHAHLLKLVFTKLEGQKTFVIQAKMKFDYMVFQFIKFCTTIDPRIAQLGTFLNFWAKERNLLDKVIKPNALYLLMIFYLMKTDPPLIPDLFERERQKETEYKLSKKKSPNTITLRGMKKQDGRYLTREGHITLDYEMDIDNIREKILLNSNDTKLGELIYNFFKDCLETIIKPKHRINIKEMTLESYPDINDMAPNLSRNLKGDLDTLIEEIKLAYTNLKEKNLAKLCAKKKEA